MSRFIPLHAREIAVDVIERLNELARPDDPAPTGHSLALLAPLTLMSAAGNLSLSSLEPERDAFAIATAETDDLTGPVVFGVDPVVRATLPEVADDRQYHPDYVRPDRRISGTVARVQASPRAMSAVQFANPGHVVECVRRYDRRRAFIALGHGGGNHRPPRRRMLSSVEC